MERGQLTFIQVVFRIDSEFNNCHIVFSAIFFSNAFKCQSCKPNPARQVDFQVFLSHHSRAPPTPTLARMLKGHGFLTAHLGKYHVGHSLQPSDCGADGSGAAHEPFVRASLLADSNQRASQSCHTPSTYKRRCLT